MTTATVPRILIAGANGKDRSGKNVTAVIADSGPDGMIYRLADDRGYTRQTDTIRVSAGRDAGRNEGYTVYVWRKDGWTFLLSGRGHNNDIDYPEATMRAVVVLYGLEDHG